VRYHFIRLPWDKPERMDVELEARIVRLAAPLGHNEWRSVVHGMSAVRDEVIVLVEIKNDDDDA
jgi:hypothetical protein